MAMRICSDPPPRARGPVQDEHEYQSLFDATVQAVIEGRKMNFGLSLHQPLKAEEVYLAWPPAVRVVALNYRPRP